MASIESTPLTTLINAAAKQAGITQAQAKDFTGALTELLANEMDNGRRVQVRGLGTFEGKVRGARVSRNPQNGEPVHVPARMTRRFRPSPGSAIAVG